MTKKINLLVIIYFSFLTLLFVSGALSGIGREVVYYLAFLLPFCIGIFFDRRNELPIFKLLTIDRRGLSLILPSIAPSIGLIMLVSYLTNLVIYRLTGITNSIDVGDSVIYALLYHALLPAILEEMLFRYLPLRMLSSYSRRVTVLFSALCFALVHHNLFTIPYAFLAGVIFMALDLWANSIIPSLVLHFVNNLVSILMIFYPGDIILIILAVVILISLVFIFINRDLFVRKTREIFAGGEKFTLSSEVVIFTFVTLFISVLSLLGG